MTGRVTLHGTARTYDAECGLCGATQRLTVDVGGQQKAERELRYGGWVRTVHAGWICRGCASKRRKRRDGTVVTA